MDLKGEIIRRQKEDLFLVEEIRRIGEGRQSMFELREENSLWFQNRICVPDISEVKEVILRSSPNTLFDTSGKYEDVYGFKRSVLVE